MSDPLLDMAMELMARDGPHPPAAECNWTPDMVGPECRPSKALRKATQTREPSAAAPRFAKGLSYTLAALVGLAILPGLLHRLRTHRPLFGSYLTRTPLYVLLAAACRLLGYARPDLKWSRTRWGSYFRFPAPLAHMLVIISFAAGSIAWCFAVRPYYRPAVVWGVSPLGFRAGFFVQGMIPFLFACAQKVNPITWLTTISHERLQVFHHWLARLMLFFAYVHAIAFLWQPYHDGGWSNLSAWVQAKPVYKTGAVCLALFTVLIISACRYLRTKQYELFVLQHILLTCTFLGFYFKHADNEQGCDAWTWAAVALWSLSTLLRWMGSLRNLRFGSSKASIEALGGGASSSTIGQYQQDDESPKLLRIAIRTSVRWAPGQHVFIRFPTLTPLQAHPFTILSLARPKEEKGESEVVIVAKVQGGMTADLWNRVKSSESNSIEGVTSEVDEKQWGSSSEKGVNGQGDAEERTEVKDSPGLSTVPDLLAMASSIEPSPAVQSSIKRTDDRPAQLVRAMIDGPCGSNASMASYDAVLLIAGGVGITFALPILFDLAHRALASSSSSKPGSTGRDVDQSSTALERNKALVTRRIKLLWSLRDEGMLKLFRPQLDALSEAFQKSAERQGAHPISYSVEIHLTSGGGGGGGHGPSPDASEEGRLPTPAPTTSDPEKLGTRALNKGRASLSDEVHSFIRSVGEHQAEEEEEHGPSSVAIGCCGPQSMGDVVSQASSKAQWDVLRRRTGNVREVYLANEAFGW